MKSCKKDIRRYSKIYLDECNKDISFETILVGARREQVLKSLSKYKHDNILEIGCGLEPLFSFCSGYKSFTVIEPSREFCVRARKLAAGKSAIRILQGYAEDICKSPQKGGNPEFDFIVLSGLLHEVPSPDKLMRAIRGICRTNTIAHINVPNVYSFHRLLAYEAGMIKSFFEISGTGAKLQRQAHFDKTHLIKLIHKTGFRCLSFGTYFIKPFTNLQMEKMLAAGIITPAIIDGLEKMAKYMPEMGCEMFVEVKLA